MNMAKQLICLNLLLLFLITIIVPINSPLLHAEVATGGGESRQIILNEYCDLTSSKTWIKTINCIVGDIYTLPEADKPGCSFDGWLGGDGVTIYPAGTELSVTDTISLTAQYTALTLIIDGQEYDASERHGDYALGWHYYPNRSGSITYSHNGDPIYNVGVQLDIYGNYSGKPITIPCDTNINLYGKSMTATNASPVITVNGNVIIHVSPLQSPTLGAEETRPIVFAGGNGAPAIAATGRVTIDVISADDETEDATFNIIGGSDNVPAISSDCKILVDEKVYYAGTDTNNLSLVGKYSGEHYLSIEDAWTYSIELSGITTVPTLPDNDTYTFLGWSTGYTSSDVWYEPGDRINAGTSTTLKAIYLDNNRSSVAIYIDGNGGTTSSGSNYFVQIVSSSNLSLYTLPTSGLAYSGHSLTGYNSTADGSGTSYSKGGSLSDDDKTLVYSMYAQWNAIGISPLTVSEEEIFDKTFTLTLSSGSYIDGIGADQISLGGDFSRLTIGTVVKNADNILNVQINGNLKKDTGNGSITLSAEGTGRNEALTANVLVIEAPFIEEHINSTEAYINKSAPVDTTININWGSATKVNEVLAAAPAFGLNFGPVEEGIHYTVTDNGNGTGKLVIKKELFNLLPVPLNMVPDGAQLVITIKYDNGDESHFYFTVTSGEKTDECFIATAAFGSKFDWPVSLLRHFRDQYLLTNAWGTTFVNFYYKHSPPIAAMIATSFPLKILIRVLLAPVIALVYLIYHPAMMVFMFGAGVCMLVVWFKRRRYLHSE